MKDYLVKLQNLVPDAALIDTQSIAYSEDTLLESACLIQSLCQEIIKEVGKLPKVDLVVEVTEAINNIEVLGHYLAVGIISAFDA